MKVTSEECTFSFLPVVSRKTTHIYIPSKCLKEFLLMRMRWILCEISCFHGEWSHTLYFSTNISKCFIILPLSLHNFQLSRLSPLVYFPRHSFQFCNLSLFLPCVEFRHHTPSSIRKKIYMLAEICLNLWHCSQTGYTPRKVTIIHYNASKKHISLQFSPFLK